MKYFTISELEYSAKAKERGIVNKMPAHLMPNAVALVDKVLDPLRAAYGKPISVNSGYRNAVVNKLVGGGATSQHLTAQAADITVRDLANNQKLFQMIIDMKLPFDQLINENGFQWVHVSHRADGKNRGEVLEYKNGKYFKIR